MFAFISFLILIALAATLYCIVFTFTPDMDSRLVKMLKRVRRKASPGAGKAGRGPYEQLKKVTAKLVILPEARRADIDRKLYRAGYEVKADMFYADIILRVAAVFLLAPVFFLLDIKIAAAGTIVLCFGLYYKWANEPDAYLRAVSADIADELPRFVSVIGYSMATDRDLMRTVERYLKIARPALKRDLELLLLEMKAGNYAEALTRFDARIANPRLSAFISGLIDAGRGVDQKTFFYLMEENMKQMFIENRKRELAKRPAKVKKAIISVGLCMFVLYLVPICVQLTEGLAMFK